MTIVCGDSHTSTHGAFGALAFGIGTSEVEHVLATQTLWQGCALPSLGIEVTGRLPAGLEPKDIILRCDPGHWNRRGHGPRHRVPRPGDLGTVHGRANDRLQHVDRGSAARGLIAPDDTTFEYIASSEPALRAAGDATLEAAIADWKTLKTEDLSGL